MLLSNQQMRRVGQAVRRSENNPEPYGAGNIANAGAHSTDTFCYAYVVDATGPVVASGSKYDLTQPVLCQRVAEDRRRAVTRVDTSEFDSIDIDIDLTNDSGTTTITVNPSSDTTTTLTDKLVGAGALDGEGLIFGKYIYLYAGTQVTLSLQPNLAVAAECNEWVLGQVEKFFLSKVPSKDLQPGDLVGVHFSQSQGGVIVPQEVTTVEDDCCTNRVINNTDLQLDIPTYQGGTATGNTRTINTTSTWVAELKRDLTLEIDGGFVRLLAGDYAMNWVPASESWARQVESDLVFMTTTGIVLGSDLTTNLSAIVNNAYLEMKPDDGAGNVSLSLVVDATIVTP